MKCKEWILRLVEVEEICSVSDLKHVTGFLSIFIMFYAHCSQRSRLPVIKGCNTQSKIQPSGSIKSIRVYRN